MDRETKDFHWLLIRLLRGVLSAWEKWLTSRDPKQQQEQQDTNHK